MSTLLWVTVPGGAVRDARVPLRILLVPRLSGLTGVPTIADYGFADWPARLARTLPELVVERADDPAGFTTVLSHELVAVPAGQRPTWSEVFKPTTTVRSFTPLPTYDRNSLHVEPTATHAGSIRDVYTEVAAHGGDAAAIPGPLGTAELQGVPPTIETTATDAVTVPDPDFHRAVAALREHPTVLQSIGLVLELRLTEPSQLGERGLIRVRCPVDPDVHPISGEFPWTEYVHVAAPRPASCRHPPPARTSPTAWSPWRAGTRSLRSTSRGRSTGCARTRPVCGRPPSRRAPCRP